MPNSTFNESSTNNSDSHVNNMEALLRQSADSLPLKEPPCDNWLAIKRTLPKAEVNKEVNSHLWPKMLSLAASISFVLVGFLSWQNYKLQDQLETVLVANYLLEEQFAKANTVTYIGFSPELAKLEEQLMLAKSTEEKLRILIKRKSLFEAQLKKKEGVNNEFSI